MGLFKSFCLVFIKLLLLCVFYYKKTLKWKRKVHIIKHFLLQNVIVVKQKKNSWPKNLEVTTKAEETFKKHFTCTFVVTILITWWTQNISATYCCLLLFYWKFKMIHIWATSWQKPTKWHVRPAKTQISLGIRQIYQSLRCALSG